MSHGNTKYEIPSLIYKKVSINIFESKNYILREIHLNKNFPQELLELRKLFDIRDEILNDITNNIFLAISDIPIHKIETKSAQDDNDETKEEERLQKNIVKVEVEQLRGKNLWAYLAKIRNTTHPRVSDPRRGIPQTMLVESPRTTHKHRTRTRKHRTRTRRRTRRR